MDAKLIVDYLTALEQNNCREWYHANKEWYKAANAEFLELVTQLILELRQIDPAIPMLEAGELTFKLVRDTRFSNDKSPYNPSFRAHIGPKGKMPVPVGYFVNITPGGHSFLGGGLFGDMFKDATAMMREYISTHGSEWQNIITNPDFAARFTVRGVSLKKVPQGYDAAHPQAEYLKHKSWYLEYPISDRSFLQPDFVALAAGTFAAMRPFNDYMNKALKEFAMPARP